MAQPQHSWVLRCCNCRLFQAHQVKKSLKWTCKACGEKQSFLRAYGEGSGADCRRHVQKLNLLQGQVSELSLRSLGDVVSAHQEGSACCGQAEDESAQGKCQRSENRWLKYLDVGYPGPGPGGGEGLHTQPIPDLEQPGPPYIQGLPGKRKWNQSSAQPPHGLDVQDLDGAATTLETQESIMSLIRTGQEGGSHFIQHSVHCSPEELGFPQRELCSPAPQIAAPSSKWARFLRSPGHSSDVHTGLLRPVHRGPHPAKPAQAKQGTLGTETLGEGPLSRPTAATQLPQATPIPGPTRPCEKVPGQPGPRETPLAEAGPWVQGTQKAPAMQLCHLFSTGEDFDDDLN